MKTALLALLLLAAACGSRKDPPLPSLTDSVDQALAALPAPAPFPEPAAGKLAEACRRAFCGIAKIEAPARRELAAAWPTGAGRLAAMVVDPETPASVKGEIMTFLGRRDGPLVARFCRHALEARPEQAQVVRRRAVVILGEKGSAADVPSLVLRLKYERVNQDADPFALAWAARALGRLQNLSGVIELVKLLADPEVREEAGACLVEILGLEGIEWPREGTWDQLREKGRELAARWKREGRSSRDRRRLIDPELKRRFLVRIARCRQFNLRYGDDARFILGRCGWTGVEPLGLALRDKSREIRKLALECAADLGPLAADLGPLAAPLLHDRLLATFAIETLGRIGAQEAAPYLVHLAGGKDPDLRQAALLALGRMGAEPGLPALESALADPERAPEEHMAAALALGLLGRKDRARRLLQELRGRVDVHQPTLTRYMEELEQDR